ncbi:MAG: hypothetical protein ACI9VI_001299 [Candidatus Azotimanducaceae bacterium]|jgi:hypothetical protein
MLAREELSFLWGRNRKESGVYLICLQILTGIIQKSSQKFNFYT